MAAKKKKSRAKVEASLDNKSEGPHLPVQPPASNDAAEAHAPVLAKPRKKNRNKPGETDSVGGDCLVASSNGEVFSDILHDAESSAGGNKPPPPAMSAPGNMGTSRNDGLADQEAENDRHWGVETVEDGNTDTAETADAPVHLSFLGRARKDGAVKGQGKAVEYLNPARKEALEAVSDFKSRILERAAKQALNDTPFTPSPYPDDLYLYEKPNNTPEDKTMLDMKRAFDTAISELDPSLVPERTAIPLHIAKRSAMYISGLLQAHDAQFLCALDGLRAPLERGQEPLAPWVADTWEERLMDSDRDWLLSKMIENMDDEKARKHVGDMMEFIFKYKLWGHMVEGECAEMGIMLFPRLG